MTPSPLQLTLNIIGILGHPDTVNVYFLQHEGRAVLVDTGRDPQACAKRILSFWRELGKPRMEGIILTHAHIDHSGAALELRDHWQVPLSMHPADQVILEEYGSPLVPDRELHDGQLLDTPIGEFKVLHTPGHAPGHVALYRASDALLLSGDQVLSNGTTYVGEPHGNMTEYLESFRKLLRLGVARLASGHGPVLEDGHARILEMHEYRLRREGEILMSLRQGHTTAEQIAQQLYLGMGVSPAVLMLGGLQTECHLEHLARLGAVRQQDGNWHLQ